MQLGTPFSDCVSNSRCDSPFNASDSPSTPASAFSASGTNPKHSSSYASKLLLAREHLPPLGECERDWGDSTSSAPSASYGWMCSSAISSVESNEERRCLRDREGRRKTWKGGTASFFSDGKGQEEDSGESYKVFVERGDEEYEGGVEEYEEKVYVGYLGEEVDDEDSW